MLDIENRFVFVISDNQLIASTSVCSDFMFSDIQCVHVDVMMSPKRSPLNRSFNNSFILSIGTL